MVNALGKAKLIRRNITHSTSISMILVRSKSGFIRAYSLDRTWMTSVFPSVSTSNPYSISIFSLLCVVGVKVNEIIGLRNIRIC